jgi:hypothetical protein
MEKEVTWLTWHENTSPYLREREKGLTVKDTQGIDPVVIEKIARRALDIHATWLYEWARTDEPELGMSKEDAETYIWACDATVLASEGEIDPKKLDFSQYLVHIRCAVVDELNHMQLLVLVDQEQIAWIMQEVDTDWSFIYRGTYPVGRIDLEKPYERIGKLENVPEEK